MLLFKLSSAKLKLIRDSGDSEEYKLGMATTSFSFDRKTKASKSKQILKEARIPIYITLGKQKLIIRMRGVEIVWWELVHEFSR